MGKKRASFSNTMSCPYCLKNINFDSKNKQSKHMFNESQSQELLSHMEKCKSGQQTILKFPEEKYLKFREVVKKSMEISILLFELSHPPNEWKNRHCIIWYSLTACCVGTCFTWRYLNKLQPSSVVFAIYSSSRLLVNICHEFLPSQDSLDLFSLSIIILNFSSFMFSFYSPISLSLMPFAFRFLCLARNNCQVVWLHVPLVFNSSFDFAHII